MKVNLKSVIKTSNHQFECFEEQQIIVRSGNTLCIRSIGKSDFRFICLHKNIKQLYSFKPSTNKRYIFTAEKIGNDLIIAQYNLESDRKTINLTIQSTFFCQIDKLQLLVDEYDNDIVYGSAKNKEITSIFLIDFSKMKILAIGYLPPVEDFKLDYVDNMTVTICGNNGSYNYVKYLKYSINQWEIFQKVYKRVQGNAFHHELLPGGRLLIATRTDIYIYDDQELIQTIDFSKQDCFIEQIIKLNRGIIVKLSNQSLKILIEDSDQASFIIGNELAINLEPEETIFNIKVSHNMEEVILNTTKNNFYTWKCNNLSIQIDKSELIFSKMESGCNHEQEGNISISTGKKLCLLTGSNNVTLWSIERNEHVLSSRFETSQGSDKKVLFAGAINPDGSSILLAFEDKIKLFKILFTKFKLICQLPIKRCQNIIFSHGGQLAACRYGKGANSCLTIVNMLRLVQICNFKIQAEPSQFIWNQLDDQILISTQNNTIQLYKISENIRIHNIKIPQPITQVRIDYKAKKTLVSSEKYIFVLQDGKIVEKIVPPIDNFCYMFPLYGVYFISTKNGQLCWSYSQKFETYHQIPVFSGMKFQMVCRNSYLVAFSSFEDITVLHCQRGQNIVKKSQGEQIVMIERDEILSLFQKVRIIQSNYEIFILSAQTKIQQQKNKYENAIIQYQHRYIKQLQFMKNKYAQLSMTKIQQERQSEKIFQKIEYGQIQSVNDLEKMYDRKYCMEKQKYLTLEQAFLSQKLGHQKLLLQLQKKYHSDVESIRNQYSNKLKQQFSKVEDVKNGNLDEKKRMEIRLIELQEQNEVTLCDLQSSKDMTINDIKVKYLRLQQECEKYQIIILNQKVDLQNSERQTKNKQKELQIVNNNLKENINRVRILQKQIARKDLLIQQKNKVISQQQHHIVDLEKAKYVLSFRTTQIRKELQPKQGLVDKLKSQLLKLDEEFRQQKLKNHNLDQKNDKLDKIIEMSKRQIADLKISLKHKQRLHEDLCSEIFTIINNLDQKQWNTSLVKIYKQFIKEDHFKNKGLKKKDDTSEEINRHLIHVEQSLMHVTSGTQKMLRGKDKEVTKKMKENSELVYELNIMRKKENQFLKQKKELVNENQKLKRQFNESFKSTTRSLTSNTGVTRRAVVSRDGYRQKTMQFEVQEAQKSLGKVQVKTSRIQKLQKSRIVSARRTLMVQDEKKSKNTKLFDIARQLQQAKTTIKRQDKLIQQLNQRLLGIPSN